MKAVRVKDVYGSFILEIIWMIPEVLDISFVRNSPNDDES